MSSAQQEQAWCVVLRIVLTTHRKCVSQEVSNIQDAVIKAPYVCLSWLIIFIYILVLSDGLLPISNSLS